MRHSFFNFLTSDGQVWIYLRILRTFPAWAFYVSVNKDIIISKIFKQKFFQPIIFYTFRNLITNQKKIENIFFEKFQNSDVFISPKRKKPVLEMALRSSNISKINQQMSKNWKQTAAHELKLLVNLTGWKTEYLIAQLKTGFRQKVHRLKTCPQGVLEAQ